MPRKRYVIQNHKGGVGKSFAVVHLAGELARRGNRVLIVDTDTQNHAGKWLGIKKFPGVHNLLVNQAKFADVSFPVQPMAYDPQVTVALDLEQKAVAEACKLWVLPSDQTTEVVLRLTKNPNGLKRRLMEIESSFDYILMDTSPTSTEFEVSLLLAAEGFIYVTDCDYLSMDGLRDTMFQLQQVDDFDMDRFLGIIPNHFDRTKDARERLEQLKSQYGDHVWPEVPHRIAIRKSPAFGRTLYTYDPENDAIPILRKIVDRFEQVAQ